MNTLIRSLVLLLALAGFSIPASAQHRLVTGAASEGFTKKDTSPRLIRQRAVNLDLAVLGASIVDQKRYLEIAFFDDAVLRAILTKTEKTHSGGQAYAGHLASGVAGELRKSGRGGVFSRDFVDIARRIGRA